MIVRLAALFALLLVLTGCSGTLPGSTRVLGAVDYDAAFAAARSTLSQFSFSIVEADPDSGLLLSRPTYVDNESRVLLGTTPTRKVARMHLTQGSAGVTARLSIEVQQEMTQTTYPGNPGYGGLSPTYSGVPDNAPPQTFGPISPEQNTVWQRVRYDRQLERTILEDLAKALGVADTEPTEPMTPTEATGTAQEE